jgi:hypothetical protein
MSPRAGDVTVLRSLQITEMIRCYYTKETLAAIPKAGRLSEILSGCLMFITTLIMIGVTVRFADTVITVFAVFCTISFCIFFYFHHRLNSNLERTALQQADEQIILDDNEIRLIRADGIPIALPRNGLKIESPYGGQMFVITNPSFASNCKIVLFPFMENARELVDVLDSRLWDQMEKIDPDAGD